jgi:hypothetical protein
MIDPLEKDESEQNLTIRQFYIERIDDFIVKSELKKMNNI